MKLRNNEGLVGVPAAFKVTLDMTTKEIMEMRTRYARAPGQKKIEVVSFRCDENLLNKIEQHCKQHEGLSQSMLVSDLVALGLSVYNNMLKPA